MEVLVNCNIVVDIETIENISGSNQYFEIIFSTPNKDQYKLKFDSVWDIRCATENGYIDRFSKFERNVKKKSNILMIENSKYKKYFEHQSSGTRPMEEIENYIISDMIDTVIELLTSQEPTLEKMV
ncbi:hypothetical protein EDD63_1112 [Breznakia blatticola]|uniref:Uncharacterized protein n=1 Tax=Breznakia blatticola TaxID=1754012 RepID=A0A4R7ZY09_9FIRM|nr:hypothetical protein [Breznakia blatticola]TDW20590.1 hypothetical protein EDD63_1112 [Breznakia blatticola]